MGKIVSISNQKGGVAKTTTAINLSAALAEMGKKVLLIDLDPQANSTSGLGIDVSSLAGTIYDVLINDVPLEHIVAETKYDNFFVAPASIQLAGAEVELVNEIQREMKLKKSIGRIRENFDYAFIDTPPSLGLLTLNALSAADSVLIPIQCEYYALEGLSQLLNTVTLVQKHFNSSLEIEGFLLTMFDARTNLSIQVVDEVKKHFPNKIFRSIIPRNVRLSEAPSHGKHIFDYDNRSKGAELYRELAKEVTDHE